MKDIRWAAVARDDLEAIDGYYRNIDFALADDLIERVIAAASFLSATPAAGPTTLTRDRRKWRVSKTPYVLFYRIAADHVRILRVLHSARHDAGS